MAQLIQTLLTNLKRRFNLLNMTMNYLKGLPNWLRNLAEQPPVAHQAPTRCPVCTEPLHIVRLECERCATALEGHFTLGRLQRLSREQWQFVEVFVKCRGKIKDVEEQLGLSYPTVVARLNDVVRAMGYETPAEDDAADARRQEVLNDLAAGRISAAEAAQRLRGQQGGAAERTNA